MSIGYTHTYVKIHSAITAKKISTDNEEHKVKNEGFQTWQQIWILNKENHYNVSYIMNT